MMSVYYYASAGIPGSFSPDCRVIALLPHLADFLLSLDISPVGIVTEDDQGDRIPEYLQSRANGITGVGKARRPDIDKIRSLRPNLIVGEGKKHLHILQTLNEIAPTVLLSDMSGDWRQLLRFVAGLFGREAMAEERLALFDHKVRQTAAELGPCMAGKTCLFLNLWKGKMVKVYTPSTHLGQVMHIQLGLQAPGRLPEAADRHLTNMTLGNIGEFRPDVLFVLDSSREGASRTLADFGEAWTSLDPVRSGRSFVLAPYKDGVEGKGLLQYTGLLDQVNSICMRLSCLN
jgi:iron complex transport system substrate-binding protein